MILNTFNLELAMANKAMDCKALAESAGVAYPTVTKARRGLNTDTRTIGKIARALGVDVKEIVKEQEEG